MKRSWAALAVAAMLAPVSARATEILTFDDVPTGPAGVYQGVDFGTGWAVKTEDTFRVASSGTHVVIPVGAVGRLEEWGFNLPSPTVFVGAFATGCDCASIQYRLYNNGALVHTSDWFYFEPVTRPVGDYHGGFYASGYTGLVDTVTVYGRAGYWALDDVTLGAAGGVPEPATWALMILGLGATGSVLRRRRTALGAVRA